METFLIYLLKSSGLLLLFYGTYQLFLIKETLFNFNRWFLISGLTISMILPIIYFEKTVLLEIAPIINNTLGAEYAPPSNISKWSWPILSLIIYLLGICVFTTKFISQFFSVQKFISHGNKEYVGNCIYVKTTKNIQPFSFFNYIVYNPTNHNKQELELILAHEQIHANQKHSLDNIFMELVLLLQWFNPTAWFYRTSLKQNLEFLADTENIGLKNDKKLYQYLLLKQVVGNELVSISNPFFNSFIKKRIVMINQTPSQKIKALKSLFILPFLALFLVSFNVKTVYTIGNTSEQYTDKTVIELTIDKNTTDDELLKMKLDLTKEKFDFSYTTIRNKNGEIKDITLHITGGNKTSGKVSSRFNTTSDNDTIDPTYIFIDTLKNTISIGNTEVFNKSTTNASTLKIAKNNDTTSVNTMSTNAGSSINTKKDSSDTFIDKNGKDNTEEQVIRINSDTTKNVVIGTSPTEEYDVKISEEEGKASLFIKSSGNKEPLFILDGKKTTAGVVKSMNPDSIESINVLKGENALKLYDEKAKNGVVEIRSKNSNTSNSTIKIRGYEENKIPLYLVDGKEISHDDMDKIDPNTVEAINVIKREKAIEKHGKKAKNGVVEITLKKD